MYHIYLVTYVYNLILIEILDSKYKYAYFTDEDTKAQ